ncbi:MAG TPA: hypothetical protein VLJ18_10715 [Thermoanaerobaculia bacterium]|nr:hypothetical protein [Thermoanaerobaculia bacterium]
MHDTRRFLVLALSLALSVPALAEDKCSVKAVLGGKPVTMKHCIAAVFEDQHSVTLYFSDTAFTAKEVDSFHVSSYATDKNEAGKPRTMMHFAFCPGGGKPAASAAAVKSVETSVNHADSFMVSRQWVFELPKDKESLKFEKLTGNIVPGGTISGRITGGKLSDGSKYSWEADFDFTLPAKDAAAGPGCGY